MKTIFKLLGYLTLILSGLVILAIIIVNVISDEQYKEWAIAAAESATGRTLVIDGPLNLHVGGTVGLLAQDISFSNTDWGTRENMITADRLFVQISLLPLLKGVFDITVELDAPDIILEKNEEGVANWVFTPSPADGEEKVAEPEGTVTEEPFTLPLKPYIRNFKISNLVFSYSDPSSEKTIAAELETLRLWVDDKNVPIIINAVYQGAPITLNGTLGQIDDYHSNRQTPIILEGKLNEAAITLEGTAGPIFPKPAAELALSLSAADIATFTPLAGITLPQLTGLDVSLSAQTTDGHTRLDNLDLSLDDPHVKAHITGSVNDIANIDGIRLDADISTDQGTALGKKLGTLNIESIPDSIVMKASVAGNLERLSLTNIDISLGDDGLEMNLSGKMEDILKLKGADAILTGNLRNLDIVSGYIGKELPPLGPFDLSAKVTSIEDGTQLESLLLSLKDPTLSAEVSATAGSIALKEDNTFEINNISLTTQADSTKSSEMLSKIGIRTPASLPSKISFNSTATGNLETLGVDSLKLAIKDEGIDANLAATIDNVLNLSGINATLTADAADTASLSEIAGMEIPALGSLKLNSRITSTDSSYKLEALDVTIDGEEVQAKLNATIKDLLTLAKITENQENIGTAGIDMTLDVDLASLSQLVTDFTGLNIPDLGALILNGQMRSLDKTLALESLNLQLDSDDMHPQVKATAGDLLALVKSISQKEMTGNADLDLSMNADIASISEVVSRTAGVEIPELGKMQIQGKINSDKQTLQLESLTAILQNEGVSVNVDTTIADIMSLSGLESTLDAKIESLNALSTIARSELPETGPWLLKAQATSEGIKKSPLLFKAKLEGEKTATVVDATIPDIASPQTLLAKVTLDAQSLSTLGTLFEKELPDKDLKLSSNISITPGEYKIDKLLMLLGNGKILSELVYTNPSEGTDGRKNLTGQITIQDVDITPLYALGEPQEISETEAVEDKEAVEEELEEKTSTGDKKLFSTDPLAVGALQDYDVDLKLDAKGLTVHEGFSLDGNMALTLDHGLLTVEPFTFAGDNGGTADGEIILDARNEAANLDVLLDFNDFVLPRLGGKFSLDADLEGTGDSIAVLMGSLDGIFVARINDVQLEKTRLSQYGAGLLSQINPLGSDVTTLECAVLRLDITEGMVDFEKKLAAQTTEVTWIGGGEINLKTEELDVGIAPKARKAISSLTNIGLASLVHVGGTLAEPNIGIDAMDVAKKYAGYTALIATGGLSFLAQKAYDNRVSNIDQCERILGDLEDD